MQRNSSGRSPPFSEADEGNRIIDLRFTKTFIYGSSPCRVGDFGLISYRVEHAGEDFQAQVLFVA